VRKKPMLITDILNSLYESHEGLKITHLMRKSNIPYNRIVPLIRELEVSGFVIRENKNGNVIYHITGEGFWYLDHYGNVQKIQA
jgi:predicted transcriptional regulator